MKNAEKIAKQLEDEIKIHLGAINLNVDIWNAGKHRSEHIEMVSDIEITPKIQSRVFHYKKSDKLATALPIPVKDLYAFEWKINGGINNIEIYNKIIDEVIYKQDEDLDNSLEITI